MLQETRGKAVVAVKFDVVECSGDTVPAGHRGSFDAPYVGLCDHDYTSKAEGLADQDDFNLNGSSSRELLGAEEIDARGADIPCDESDGMMFSRAVCGPKTERQVERSAGIFTVLGKNAYGMGWNAGKTARLRGNEERLQSQRRRTRSFRPKTR